jgi:hypothetical protein
MRTRITCGWLVAHADGHHTLWHNAELVHEGNTVLFVGERFDASSRAPLQFGDRQASSLPLFKFMKFQWLGKPFSGT